MNHKWFVIAAVFLGLFGCGGDGGSGGSGNGGGGYNPPAPPITPGLEQALITRWNAVPLMDTSFTLTDLSRSIMYDFPYLANYVMYYAENGEYYEKSACDNQGGTATVEGDLSEYDATGEITYTDNKCVNNQYDIRTDGVIRITIDRTDLVAFPIIYTVSFEDYETTSANGSYGTVLNGTIEVYSPSGSGQVVTADIKITDIHSGVYLEADGLTIASDIAVGDYPYVEDTRVSGTVGYSEYGTVELSSGSSIMEFMDITGRQDTGIRVAFLDEVKFIASLDDDGDGSPNAYMTATVSELSEEPWTNDDPIVRLENTVIEVDRGSPIIVSLLGVTDPDCDFLGYSIDLIESPTGSQFDWSIDNNLNLVINVDQAGDYSFELVVDDGHNGVRRKLIILHIMLDFPEVKLGQTLFQYTSGDQVEIDLSPSNMDQGPFTFNLSSPISGMTINDSGLLQWKVPSLDYFPQGTMKTIVTVSNVSHEVEVPLTFLIIDPDPDIEPPIARSGIEVPYKERNIHVGDFDNDGVTEILLTDNNNLIYTLEWRSGEYVQDWVYPYEINLPDDSIDAILPLDLDGDGLYAIFVQTGLQIKVISINEKSITSSMDFAPFIVDAEIEEGWGLAAADLDSDGFIELAALFGDSRYDNTGMAFVMDAADLGILWQTPVLELGKSISIGNVDNDTDLEIVFSGGYVYDGAIYNNEWVYSEEFGDDIIVADINGDGIDEIIAGSRDKTQIVYDAVQKSVFFEFTNIFDICSIAAADLDADPAKELVMGKCQGLNVLAYNVDAGSAEEIWSTGPYYGGIESLAVGDADQDSNTEVIWGVGLHTTGEDFLAVFDSVTQTIDFQNIDPSQLDGPFIGGRPISDINGDSSIVFATINTNSGYDGSRLISMDYDSGDLTISPEVGSNWHNHFNFCIADYDLDGREEVMFSSAEHYDDFISIYDLFDYTEEWSISIGGEVACGDANGDGHTDLAVEWGTSIRLYDPFNQLLLWSSPITDYVTEVELYDMDGDDILEILSMERSRLVVYTGSGSGYVEGPTYEDGSEILGHMSVGDIDGDKMPEIIISRIEGDYPDYTSRIIILNNDLSIRNSFLVNGRITATTNAGNNDNTLLVGIFSGASYRTGTESYIQSIDLQTSDIIWSSPPLLGVVTEGNIVQKPGSTKKQLAIGTGDAMYITQ